MMTDRHGIGGNQPPPHEAMGLQIEELFALVSGSTAAPVASDEQEAGLDALLDDIRKARKQADSERAAEKRPHDDAAKAVQAKWKPLLDRCDDAADAIKQALTPYRQARQAAKEAEARKALEAAKQAEQEALAAFKQSDDLEERFAAEERLKQAERLKQQAAKIDRAPTGLRTYQIAIVDDYRELLQHIMKADPAPLKAWLDEYAKKALPAALPGVRIETERRAI
jgi:DNA repair exonuclease SbcCD ATPase subunit